LLRAGATLGHTGRISCTWTDHPTQHHKIISGRGIATRDWRHQSYGINVYRQRYGIAAGTALNWQPAHGGLPVDEADRHRPTVVSVRPSPTGQRIVIAGSLGFQPDRVRALTSAGHELFGTWLPDAPFWDAAGPLPFAGVTDVPFDVDWSTRMTELAPTVVWAQFNWLAVPFLYRVFRRSRALGIPFVLHFKESPQLAVRAGYWPRLAEMMRAADGRILASAAERDWFATALDTTLPADTTLVFDGEYPPRAVQTDNWQPRLSDVDDRLHTVSVGRPMLDSVGELDAAGIDVHVYALPYMRAGAGWVKDAPNVHIHEPARPADWVREFSRYDAGWGHIAASANNGDIGVAAWTDLNLPARLATYAAAGLPWIQRRNPGHRVASRDLADDLGVGLHYDDVAHLDLLLKQERATRAAADAMRARRHLFCFDEHVPILTEFFARCARGRQP
jgi:hypothetical protein